MNILLANINPWTLDSVPCVSDADTALASCAAPTPDAGVVVNLVSAPTGPCHGPASAPTTTAGAAASASAAFSFKPDFEQMLQFIWRDFHPRDLDLDTPIAFLHNPSDEYLQALQQLAGSR